MRAQGAAPEGGTSGQRLIDGEQSESCVGAPSNASGADSGYARAQEHAPKTRDEIETAARQLAGQGYSDHTIAAILKIDVNGIRMILGPSAP